MAARTGGAGDACAPCPAGTQRPSTLPAQEAPRVLGGPRVWEARRPPWGRSQTMSQPLAEPGCAEARASLGSLHTPPASSSPCVCVCARQVPPAQPLPRRVPGRPVCLAVPVQEPASDAQQPEVLAGTPGPTCPTLPLPWSSSGAPHSGPFLSSDRPPPATALPAPLELPARAGVGAEATGPRGVDRGILCTWKGRGRCRRRAWGAAAPAGVASRIKAGGPGPGSPRPGEAPRTAVHSVAARTWCSTL